MSISQRGMGATFGQALCLGLAGAFVHAFASGAAPASQTRPATQVQPERVQTPVGTACRVDLGEDEKGKPWGQALSPDGRHVAYFTIRDAHPDKYLRMRNDLIVCAADGSGRWAAMESIPNRCATTHLVPRMVWTADGSALYCVNNEDAAGMGAVRVWRIDVASRRVKDLGEFLKDLNYFLMRAALGPDGQSLVLASSDHRLHQVDTGHNFYPVVIVTADGNEVRTKDKYKDVLSSPLGGLTVGIDAVAHELRAISPTGEARRLHDFGAGRFAVRLHFAGETGQVLLVTGGARDRRAWKPMIGFRNDPVFTVQLIAADGNAAVVQDNALQDAIVPLPQADAVLVAEVDKPYIQHPFAGTREELDLAGPLRAMPSPSAEGPYVLLHPVRDLGGGRMQLQTDQTVLLNWKTRTPRALKDKPFDDVRFPVSWSADGKAVAFSRAPGGGEPVPVPKLIDPPYEHVAGEIWVLRLSGEESK